MLIKSIVMILFLIIPVCSNCVFADTQIEESDKDTALEFIKKVLKDASDVAKESVNDSSKSKNFANIIVKSFALNKMAKTSLGPYYKKLSQDQLEKFTKFLSDYFIKTYATKEKVNLFASVEVDNGKFNKKPILNEKKTELAYKATFNTSSGEVKVKFVLIKTEKDFDIFDIIIEDIGLLRNTRDQLQEIQASAKDPEDFLSKFEDVSKLK